MKKRIAAFFLVGAMLAGAAFAAGCSNQAHAAAHSDTPSAPSAAAEESTKPAAVSEQPASESAFDEDASGGVLGDFSMQTIEGEEITPAYLEEHPVTLVNVMATWCGPCISEMPELEALYRAREEEGLGLLAVVTDLRADSSSSDTVMENAKLIQELAEITFPMVIPDENFMATLGKVQSVPTTYLLDSAGNLLTDPITGRRDAAAWAEIVDPFLKGSR